MVTTHVWVACAVMAVVICEASSEATPGSTRPLHYTSNGADPWDALQPSRALTQGSHPVPEEIQKSMLAVDRPGNTGMEIEGSVALLNPARISSNCGEILDSQARKLCSDILADTDVQQAQQISSQEEARTLQQLGQNSPYSSYINHGNAVHIQGQFHQLGTHGQNVDSNKHTPVTNTDDQQQPAQVLHSDPACLAVSSINPPSDVNREKYTTRINSKLMSSAELAQLRSLQALNNQESHSSHIFQHQVHAHQQTPEEKNLQIESQFQSPVENTNNKEGEQGHLQSSLNAQHEAASTPRSMTSPESSVVLSEHHPLSSISSHHHLGVPSGNTINVQMQDSSNSQNQEKTADMADILTNLQILTILMNQNGLHLPHAEGHAQDTLVTSVNGGNSIVNLRSQTPGETAKVQQQLTLLKEGEQVDTGELEPLPSSEIPPTDIHKSAIYQIQARNREADPKNYFTHASQFAFAINSTSEDSPIPSNTVREPVSSWFGPSYLLPEGHLPVGPPTVTAATEIPEYQPDFSFYPAVNVKDEFEDTHLESPTNMYDDGRIIYKDGVSITVADDENIDHDKLINQYTQQLVSDHNRPYTRPPHQDSPQNAAEMMSQINALSEYLENLKKKYAAQSQANTSVPPLLYDPALNSQDYILASLLHSHIQQESSSNIRPPASLPADTPYVPAYHNTNDAYDEYYAPAPPPGEASVFPIPPSRPRPQEDSSASSSSSSSSSGGYSFSNLVFSSLVAILSTSAIALPFAFGKRRRRDIDDYLLMPQNVSEFMKDQLPGDSKYFFDLLANSSVHSADEILKNITDYVSQNKKELQQNVVKDIEVLTSRPISKTFLSTIDTNDTKSLIQLLTEILTGQKNRQKTRAYRKHYARAFKFNRNLELNQAMNHPTSINFSGHTNQYGSPTVNRQRLFPPPKSTTRASHLSDSHLSSSQTLKAPHQYLYSPNLQKSDTRRQLPQTHTADADSAVIDQQVLSLYSSVCRALTEIDAVPHIDVINFIAQRCLLLAYAGFLN